MKSFSFLLLVFLTACSTIQYKTIAKKNLPELGTVGIYDTYLLENNYQPKTVVDIQLPVRLKTEFLKIEKRNLFTKKDSLNLLSETDSTLIRIEILDKVSFLNQINEDEMLLKHLKKAENHTITTEVTVSFPKAVVASFKASDEVYLIRNKQKTLSLELRKNNKPMAVVDFSEGEIIGFRSSEFCWGQNKRREIEIFDLVPEGSNCSSETHKSAEKAKKKHEFKF